MFGFERWMKKQMEAQGMTPEEIQNEIQEIDNTPDPEETGKKVKNVILKKAQGQFTVLDISDKNGVSRQTAYYLIQYLLEKNIVQQIGSMPSSGRRGRGQSVYELVDKEAMIGLNNSIVVGIYLG